MIILLGRLWHAGAVQFCLPGKIVHTGFISFFLFIYCVHNLKNVGRGERKETSQRRVEIKDKHLSYRNL